MMQAHVACLFLLCFTCGGLCTDVDQDQRALEDDLLSNLFTSKLYYTSPPANSSSLFSTCHPSITGDCSPVSLTNTPSTVTLRDVTTINTKQCSNWKNCLSLFDRFLKFALSPRSSKSAPYWRVSLPNLCQVVNSLHQEAWSSEEGEEEEGEVREGNLQLLEELYNLQHICRALKSREERLLHDSLEYSDENRDAPLKRKSPYILKRQASHSTKSRRPYILKRSTLY